ncbi:MAG: ABC transporter substrate-binding protein [Pseudomonadota bacterium]
MKKWFGLIALSAVLAFFAFGTAMAAGPQKGGALRAAAGSDIKSLDPHKIGWQNHQVLSHIYEGLLAVDEGFKIIPGLAKEWSVSEDGKTYTFKLREGILFHNGDEMTSEDARASLERLKKSPQGPQYQVVSEITTPDKYTLKVVLTEPIATFLLSLANPYTPAIMPKAEIERQGDDVKNPIGTGPFQFVEWIPDRHIKMKRFDKYWGGEGEPTGAGGTKTPYLDEIIIRPMPETAATLAALEAGDVDWAIVPGKEKARLESNPKLTVVDTGPTFEFWNFWFSLSDKSPLQDINLRQAIVHAVDKEEMLLAANGGTGSVTNSPIPKSSAFWTEAHAAGPGQDLEKAKEYLKKSDYKGQALVITTYKGYASMDKPSVVLQAQLKKIGIECELQYLDWPALAEKFKNNDFDILAYGYGAFPDPDQFYFGRLHKSVISTGWNNPKFNELVEKARTELNFEKRKELYGQAQTIILEDAPLFTTFHEAYFYGYNKKVKGFKPWAAFFHRFWNVWIEE